MEATTIQRYIGNIFLISGYFILLHFDLKTGLIIKLIGGCLTLPFAVKYKMWDVLVIGGFFGVVEIAKIIQLTSK